MGQARVKKLNAVWSNESSPCIMGLQVEKTPVELAAEKAMKAIRERSFSGRHLSLGPMINCGQCGLRHRKFSCHMTEEWKTKQKALKAVV
jgi:hypothetical protein